MKIGSDPLQSIHLTRRQLLRFAGLTTAAAIMSACGAKPSPTPAPTLKAAEMGVRSPEAKAEATAVPPTDTPPPPTTAPEVTQAVEAEATPTEAVEAPSSFMINGVTVPCKRSEAFVGINLPYVQYDGFNPFVPGGHDWTIGFQQYSHEYLWYVNYATGDVVPWLAESHEYSDDYKTLRIKVRKEAEWSDGVPFTAEDVAFTMNMLKEDRTLAGPGDVEFWDKIYADPNDPYTCVIEMTEPRPRQHTLFWCKVTSGQWIVPKHIWENEDPHTFTFSPPVTTGPYQWYGGYLEQKVVIWERNDNYWGKKIGRFPAPKFLVGAAQGDPEAGVALTKKHIYDTAQIGYQAWLDRKDEFPTLQFGLFYDACVRAFIFNCAKGPHLDKPEFRRAVCMLMNREKWAQTMMVPPVPVAKGPWPGYANMDQFINEEAKEKWGTYTYNPERAMQLLEEIGYTKDGSVLKGPDGNPVTLALHTPGGPGGIEWGSALDLITELAKIGIDATLKHYDMPVSNEMLAFGDYDIISRWLCATLDGLEEYEPWTCERSAPIGERLPGTLGTANRARLCDAEFDELVAQLRVIEPQDPRAHDLYMKAFDKHCELSPTTGTVETPVIAGFDSWYWKNLPSEENMYTVPLTHWPQFMFTFFNIEPSGREETSTE